MSFPFVVKPESAPGVVPLVRGAPRPAAARASIRLAALRVPLLMKLVGANLLVMAGLAVLWRALGAPVSSAVVIIFIALLVMHAVLVVVALRPIRDLESLASRIWRGDLGARFDRSTVADAEVLRIGSMFNILLDGLASDRARLRALATEVIAVGDRERAAIARELHDSTAQRVAALLLQLSTASRDADDPGLAARLQEARDSAEAIMDEIRLLSHTMHPALLDDLGLEAALRKLARDTMSTTGIDVAVDSKETGRGRLPTNVESVLYRVAQEAVRNATRHAEAQHIRLRLSREPARVVLEVRDDGRGFDLAAVERARAGMGLLSMHERVSLLDGWLEIDTGKGGGTSVTATIPLTADTDSVYEEGSCPKM